MLPRLRQSQVEDLRLEVTITATVGAEVANLLREELRQIAEELGLSGRFDCRPEEA